MAVSKKTTPVSKPAGKLSLVIPCYNEEQRIPQLIAGLEEFTKRTNLDYEIIIVDDGSTDATAAIIQSNGFFKSLDAAGKFRLIRLPENKGKGIALKTGVEAASGTHILTLDADMSARPVEIEKWITLNNNKLPDREIWIGSREHADSKITEISSRRWTGRIFNFCVRLLTPLRHRDTQCGFKLYPTNIAKDLFAKQRSGGWAHDIELLYRCGTTGNSGERHAGEMGYKIRKQDFINEGFASYVFERAGSLITVKMGLLCFNSACFNHAQKKCRSF
jgi:dolichyl-phosphate beta-glucosyltransferase